MRQQHTTRPLQVRAYWGNTLLDATRVDAEGSITLGGSSAEEGVDLRVEPDLPVERFTLAYHRGETADLVVPDGGPVRFTNARGEQSIQTDLPPAAAAPFPARLARLRPGERLQFDVGRLSFVAEYTDGRAELPAGSGMDWQFPRVLLASGLLHLFFIAAALITPDASGAMSDQLLKLDVRAGNVLLVPKREETPKKLSLSGTNGSKHKDPEGRFGDRNRPPRDAMASQRGTARVDPNKREEDRKIALASGLLTVLQGAQASAAVSNVLGPSGIGSGINEAMGGLKGLNSGDAGGAGGLGSRGFYSGGGGDGLGIGGIGGGNRRGGGGPGNIDLGGPGHGRARLLPGRTVIVGSLKKEEIARVIRRNLARFKFCYEKELNAQPNLVGKIAVRFKIAPTGAVAEASVRDTSMHEGSVENCVVDVMRSLKFPAPRGGGIVVVTYPFVFST